MSELRSNNATIRFEPVNTGEPPRHATRRSWNLVVLGVIYPAAVIAIELISRMCAQALFDPMPTIWHVLAVGFVPAMTLAIWARFDVASQREKRLLALGVGIATSIAMTYAILFLPFVPLAIIGLVFYGIGLLPLAPLVAAACSAICLARVTASTKELGLRRYAWSGVALGLLCLVAVEVPMLATRFGVELAASSDVARRERGLSLLRTLGDDDQLLRLCYGSTGRPVGPLGMMMLLGEHDLFSRPSRETLVSQTVAREIYYRVHGVAFNAVRAPSAVGRLANVDDFQFDPDLGGAAVGGRVKGLSLTSSRIDGSIAGDDAIAYLEWTFEFKNTSLVDREARVEIALPPGAVVSRASLWVNGEEREAAYGGRGEVRAAYQKVAVQQRRDPLLVTTKGADRVLLQAFPVTRNGGTIKFKLGMSAPLELVDLSTGRLTLPAIFDRNFTIDGDVVHAVWLESKSQLMAAIPGVATAGIGDNLYRASGRIDDRTLTRTRQAISVTRHADATLKLAKLGDGAPVVQEIKSLAANPAPTMIVIDGSSQLADKVEEIIATLDTIKLGAKIGLMIASEPPVSLPMTPWSEQAAFQVRAMLRAHAFIGGQDNTPALTAALLAVEAEPDARLLWVHGPQPQVFQNGTAALEQAVSRLRGLPPLTLYTVAAGPNMVLPDVPWAWSARLLPRSGEMARDLTGYLALASDRPPSLAIVRQQPSNDPLATQLPKGSEHIVRLWARDRVIELVQHGVANGPRDEVRSAAIALAVTHRLVTPVSGAVVLETAQQYDESRLTPATQATVPTVPEPHEWALICIAGLALIWMVRRKPGLIPGVAS